MITESTVSSFSLEFLLAKENEEYDESIVFSDKFLELRDKSLKRCLDEHKWYLSLRIGNDIGESATKEDFARDFFPSWNDGFYSAYLQSNKCINGRTFSYHEHCINKNFFLIQGSELEKTIKRYKKHISKGIGREVDFSEAMNHFLKYHLNGWRAGFRAGFCGMVCAEGSDCYLARNYIV